MPDLKTNLLSELIRLYPCRKWIRLVGGNFEHDRRRWWWGRSL